MQNCLEVSVIKCLVRKERKRVKLERLLVVVVVVVVVGSFAIRQADIRLRQTSIQSSFCLCTCDKIETKKESDRAKELAVFFCRSAGDGARAQDTPPADSWEWSVKCNYQTDSQWINEKNEWMSAMRQSGGMHDWHCQCNHQHWICVQLLLLLLCSA